MEHQTDVHGLAKATCLRRIRHVIYARYDFGPEYKREFRPDTVHLPCSRCTINTFHNQQTAQQDPLVCLYRRHRQNVSPVSYSHLHVYFVYHCSLKMAIRNRRNILAQSPVYVDTLHMFCSLLVIKLVYDFRPLR